MNEHVISAAELEGLRLKAAKYDALVSIVRNDEVLLTPGPTISMLTMKTITTILTDAGKDE